MFGLAERERVQQGFTGMIIGGTVKDVVPHKVIIEEITRIAYFPKGSGFGHCGQGQGISPD